MRDTTIRRGNTILWRRCRVAEGLLERLRGIMFEKPMRGPMLIPFDRRSRHANGIHSFFCRVRFDAVFIDTDGTVVDIVGDIPASRPLIRPSHPCLYVLETPAGQSKRLHIKDKLRFS